MKKDKSAKKHLMTGNEAIGEGAVRAGCDFYAGYPITPQNELTAFMSYRMRQKGRVFLQSESELSAINMVFGASVAGKRAMTSSSSPGISLKQEGISYLAACRLPAVIVNVMRGGPGLGNIAPSQGDYFQATKGGGHGDYHMIVLAPGYVEEAMSLTMASFDLSDKYRVPAMILTDGMLGQMMEPVEISKYKVKTSGFVKKPWALTGAKARPAQSIKSLFLKPGALEDLNISLQKVYAEIRSKETRYEAYYCDGAKFIVVAYGSVSRVAKAAVKSLRAKGRRVGLLRPITLWPFPEQVIKRLAKKAKVFFAVEMSAGQMVEDVRLAVEGRSEVHFLGRMGGGIPSQNEIEQEIARLHR
ncbi:MAG: 3-methyl-2-oxobutanoate dehydrogenase subunit VorB [Candidatus Omnitrophica bacterium]|nr:3-methyl-2-oxobutanoate dehydrogenase subunit VorB [Candidatus Omnitrophota bacterium]